jgi:hypothetical protein
MPEFEFKDVVTVDVLRFTANFVARDFSEVIYLVPLATNSLAGASPTAFGVEDSKYVSVTSAGAANSANSSTAGSFSATSISGITYFFRQLPRPTKITVIAVDLVGGDTYHGILQTYLNTGNDFTYVTVQTRTEAIIVAITGALAALTRKRWLVAQCNGSTIKAASSTYAAGALGTAWTAKEYCIGLCAPDAQFDDMKYVGQISTFNYTTDNCPPGDLTFVGAEAKLYLDSEVGYIKANNWNLNAKFGSGNITNNGVFADGSQVYAQLTAETFADALTVALSNLKTKNSFIKAKTPMNKKGRTMITAVCMPILQTFIDREHFDGEQEYEVQVPDFTSDMLAAKTIPVYISAAILDSAIKISVKVYM